MDDGVEECRKQTRNTQNVMNDNVAVYIYIYVNYKLCIDDA